MLGSRFRTALRAAAVALTLSCVALWPAMVARAQTAPEPHRGTELVLRALSLLGVNYKFGGNSPDTGLDCSGLVRHVFREAAGMVLPRRAEEISRAGESIDTTQLQPGDLVFYNTLRRTFSHVGIYIGNGQFVHAPSRGGGVRVEQMSESYWSKRFNGARRVLADGLGLGWVAGPDNAAVPAGAVTAAGASPAARGAPVSAGGLAGAGMMLPLTGTLLPGGAGSAPQNAQQPGH
ncbi:MAG: NlpC/P60 family protein [Burkholderiales bacterium]